MAGKSKNERSQLDFGTKRKLEKKKERNREKKSAEAKRLALEVIMQILKKIKESLLNFEDHLEAALESDFMETFFRSFFPSLFLCGLYLRIYMLPHLWGFWIALCLLGSLEDIQRFLLVSKGFLPEEYFTVGDAIEILIPVICFLIGVFLHAVHVIAL